MRWPSTLALPFAALACSGSPSVTNATRPTATGGSGGVVGVGGMAGMGGGGPAGAGGAALAGIGGTGGSTGGTMMVGGTGGAAGAGGESGGTAAGTGGSGGMTCPAEDIPGESEVIGHLPAWVADFTMGVDDTTLYWSQLGIQAMPKAGGAIRTVYSDPTDTTQAIALVEPGYIHAQSSKTALFRVPRDATAAVPEEILPWEAGTKYSGIPPVKLGDDYYLPGAFRFTPGTKPVPLDPLAGMIGYEAGGVATDGVSVYWRLALWMLKPTEKHGAWVRRLTPPSTTPVDFLVDPQWTEVGGPAKATDKHLCVSTGCYDLTGASAMVGGIGENGALSLIDEPYLYTIPKGAECEGIHRSKFGEIGTKRFWVNPTTSAAGIAADADYIYWHNGDILYRKHK